MCPRARRRPDPGGPASCLRLVDIHLYAQVTLHDFPEMVARGLEHLQPAVLPVPDAGEPRRAPPARPCLRPATRQMKTPVLVEGVAPPDVADARLPDIGEELRCAERDVLTAEGDAAQGVHVEPLEGPHTRLLALGRQILVEVLVERLAEWNRRVVVPGEELAGDHLVHPDLLQPEIYGRLQRSLRRLLADDRDDHTRGYLVL